MMTHYTNTDNPVDYPKPEMNDRLRQIMLEVGYASPELAGRARKLVDLIIQDCISQIAMIGVSNCDDDDVVWTVDKSIKNIRTHFGIEK